MNDAYPPGSSTNRPEAGPLNDNDNDASTTGHGPPTQRQRKSVQQVQKIAFLNDLIRNLDIMVYCELSILYYME